MAYRFKTNPNILALLPLLALVLLGACRKAERDEDTETVSAHDNAFAQHIYSNVFKVVHEYALQDTTLHMDGVAHTTDGCLDSTGLSNSLEFFPLTLTLDYGDETDACEDEITRYGQLISTFTGRYLTKGAEVTISFKDFVHNSDYTINGKINLKNIGKNADGTQLFLMEIRDGSIEGHATLIDFNAVQEYTWTEGITTPEDISDDVFEISGYSKGRNSRGNSFFADITVPYVFSMDCIWITEGETVLEVPNLATRTVNYGTGTCDNSITVTKYNTTTEVKL